MYAYFVVIRNIEWTALDEHLLAFVSIERRNKIMKFKFSIDRKLSLYSELLLRMQLSKIMGISSAKLAFDTGEYGKPFLRGDSRVFFNFSHCKSAILCAISLDSEVGVDIEYMEPAPFDIVKEYFHPTEKACLMSRSNEEQNKLFYKIWTQKEALLKKNGTGLIESLIKINTLDPLRDCCFTTWENSTYACAICHAPNTLIEKQEINIDEILEFYVDSPKY